MPIEIHNKIIQATAKEILSPYGIFQKGQSRVWIDDNGWYLTIIEFQPSGWSKGSFLNVGLFFLWDTYDYIVFDFPSVDSKESSRIRFNDGTQFIEYESDEQFTAEAKLLAQIALDKAIYYRQFRDINFAKKQMLLFKSDSRDTWKKMLVCLSKGDEAIRETILKQREFWRTKGMKKLSPDVDAFKV